MFMKRKRVTFNQRSKVRRQRDPIPWKYCVLTVVCGLILLSGFFVAARQHFSSVNYAIENAGLRAKVSKLEDQRRRLLVAKERASSPSRIARLAAPIGFTFSPKTVVPTMGRYETVSTRTTPDSPAVTLAYREESVEKPAKGTKRKKAEDSATPLPTAIATALIASDDGVAAEREPDSQPASR